MIENNELKGTVKNLSAQVTTLTQENKNIKDTILDLQCRSMRDNLIFAGIAIPQNTPDDPEKAVKDFMLQSLKLPVTIVKGITFHREHRLLQRPQQTSANNCKIRTLQTQGNHQKQSKGTNFGMNSPEKFRTDAEPFCQS